MDNPFKKKREILLLIFVAVFLTIVWGWNLDLRFADNGQELTYINWFNDSQLYPGYLLTAGNKTLYSFFYLLLGIVGKIAPPMLLMYLMLFSINLLAVFSVFWVAWVITKNKIAGYLAIVLTLFHNPYSLGGSGALIGDPIPGALAVPLLLFAIGFFLKERFVPAFFLVGLTANFHGAYAFYVGCMFLLYYVINFKRLNKIAVLRSFIFCGAAALPLFLWMITVREAAGTGYLSPDQWRTLIMARSYGHVSPFSWTAGTYLSFLPHIFLFFLWRPAVREHEKYRKLLTLSLAVLLLCLAGTIFSEIIPIQHVIQLVLFRSTKFIMVFGIILASRYFVEQFSRNIFVKLLIMAVVAVLFLGIFKLAYPLLALCYLDRFLCKRRLLDLGFVAALAGLSVYSWQIFAFNLNWAVKITATAVLLLGIIFPLRFRFRHTMVAMVAVVYLIAMVPLGLYEKYSLRTYEYYRSMKDAQLWLKDNTPRDELIITPPSTRLWSAYSQRGVFLNWVDIAAPIYNPSLGQEVVKRIDEYVGDTFAVINSGVNLHEAMRNAYEGWTEEDFERIAEEYNCSVIVVEKPRVLHFRPRYENRHFTVFSLEGVRNE